ncbi:Octapeptide-repeat protein T2, partial [Ophiophagus hannah]
MAAQTTTQLCIQGQHHGLNSTLTVASESTQQAKEIKAIKLYAILDQNNRSLASSAIFDAFGIKGPSTPYSLKTCAGIVEMAGRRASGYQVELVDGKTCVTLPILIECNQIPDHKSEIPTPDAAIHPHLNHIVHLIPELDPQAQIVLLLGRDILQVHKARAQINGPHYALYSQKLELGWVIIGDTCLGSMHKPTSISSMLTSTWENRHPSIFQPCHNQFSLKESPHITHLSCPFTGRPFPLLPASLCALAECGLHSVRKPHKSRSSSVACTRLKCSARANAAGDEMWAGDGSSLAGSAFPLPLAVRGRKSHPPLLDPEALPASFSRQRETSFRMREGRDRERERERGKEREGGKEKERERGKKRERERGKEGQREKGGRERKKGKERKGEGWGKREKEKQKERKGEREREREGKREKERGRGGKEREKRNGEREGKREGRERGKEGKREEGKGEREREKEKKRRKTGREKERGRERERERRKKRGGKREEEREPVNQALGWPSPSLPASLLPAQSVHLVHVQHHAYVCHACSLLLPARQASHCCLPFAAAEQKACKSPTLPLGNCFCLLTGKPVSRASPSPTVPRPCTALCRPPSPQASPCPPHSSLSLPVVPQASPCHLQASLCLCLALPSLHPTLHRPPHSSPGLTLPGARLALHGPPVAPWASPSPPHSSLGLPLPGPPRSSPDLALLSMGLPIAPLASPSPPHSSLGLPHPGPRPALHGPLHSSPGLAQPSLKLPGPPCSFPGLSLPTMGLPVPAWALPCPLCPGLALPSVGLLIAPRASPCLCGPFCSSLSLTQASLKLARSHPALRRPPCSSPGLALLSTGLPIEPQFSPHPALSVSPRASLQLQRPRLALCGPPHSSPDFTLPSAGLPVAPRALETGKKYRKDRKSGHAHQSHDHLATPSQQATLTQPHDHQATPTN